MGFSRSDSCFSVCQVLYGVRTDSTPRPSILRFAYDVHRPQVLSSFHLHVRPRPAAPLQFQRAVLPADEQMLRSDLPSSVSRRCLPLFTVLNLVFPSSISPFFSFNGAHSKKGTWEVILKPCVSDYFSPSLSPSLPPL